MKSQYEYFRNTGIAFEYRLNKYTAANKTLASYIPGRKKEDKGSCMVRGFWGDIINSPYIGWGLVLYEKKEEEHFYKQSMDQYSHVKK